MAAMWRLFLAIMFTSTLCAAQAAPQQPNPPGNAHANSPSVKSRIVIPAGTSVSLALTRPVLAKTAKVGDTIYAQVVFPVAVNNRMAIPAGTYVEGQIDSLSRPGWLSPHAHFQIHFTEIIYADGYTVQIPSSPKQNLGQPPVQAASVTTGKLVAPAEDVIAAVANAYVQVSPVSDVLLDNGTQIAMILQIPLSLNAASVAEAVQQTNPAPLPSFKSATQCRPMPGTDGTPDTVIPGTPGMPGTPDIVIPGAPGTPDTVIPGIPATPGTAPTVIPGSPGTPGISCPGPPVVGPDPKPAKYKETFQLASQLEVSGKPLPPGEYQASWQGLGPSVVVNILQKGKTIASISAKVLLLSGKTTASTPETRANSDGSVSLRSLRFAGESFALYFAHGAS